MTYSIQKIGNVDKNELAFSVNTISGACAAPFWDGIYERTVSLDSIKGLQSSLDVLHSVGKDEEAMRMIFALYDLLEMDYPEELDIIVQGSELAGLFMGEFLADIEDLMYDYEAGEPNP